MTNPTATEFATRLREPGFRYAAMRAGYVPGGATDVAETCLRMARQGFRFGPPGPEDAALQAWESGSADTTGMLCAVRAALAAQREEIAQAIEARARRIRDELWEESTGVALAAVVNEDARIAREHGKGD